MGTPAEKKTIPVAYITKWASTAGIVVAKDVPLSSDDSSLWYQSLTVIPPQQWTTDKAEAERRWRAAVEKAAASAEKKAKALRAMAAGSPKYDTKEGN